jgi:hypothetical protein
LQIRTVIALIILVLSALSIISIPIAESQQLTTSASFFTTTRIQTSESYWTSYYYTNVTTTAIATGAVSLSNENSGGRCEYYGTPFNSLGEPIHLTFTANQPTTIYILDSADLSQISMFPCGAASYRWMSGPPSLSGDFYVNLPTSGNSYFMIIVTGNGSSTVSPYVDNTIGPVGFINPISATSTLSTQVAFTVVTTTSVVSATTFLFTQSYGSWIIAAMIAIILLGVLWFGRRHKPAKSYQASEPPT